MSSEARKPVLICRALLVAIPAYAMLYVGAFLWIALRTMDYPFQLEWIEGGVLHTVSRILAGEPVYAKPSLEYVPYLYTPFYYWVASVSALVFGEGFFSARLVSFAAVCGCGALLYRLVRREGAGHGHAILSVGLFFGTFKLVGYWFHVARVDSLQLFLVLLGAVALRPGASTWRAVAAGVALALAFLTKQSALLAAAPVLLAYLITDRRPGLVAIGTFALAVVVTSVGLDRASDGWFRYYVFTVPSGYDLVRPMLFKFWRDDLLSHMSLASYFSIVGMILLLRSNGRAGLGVCALAAGLVASSWAGRVHPGGSTNTLMPAFAALSILMPLGLHFAQRELRERGSHAIEAFVLTGVVLQLAALAYNPRHALPTAADATAGERFIGVLRQVDGDVLSFNHLFVQERAGKRSIGIEQGAMDVFMAGGAWGVELHEEVLAAVRERRFGGVLLCDDKDSHWLPGLAAALDAAGYERAAPLFDDDDVYIPVCNRAENAIRPDFGVRPTYLLLRGGD